MSYVAGSVTPAAFSPWRSPPFVNDDFGDVFGFFFAISGDSFTNPELVRYAEQLRRELVLVPGSVKSLSAASFRSRSMWISRWRRWRRAGSPSTSSPQS